MSGRSSVWNSVLALDIVIRAAVMVVTVLLIREFWTYGTASDGDGLPVNLLIPPLVVYVGWNLWFIRRSVGLLVGAAPDSSVLAAVGALSLVRVWWLRLVADEVWWHHRHRLTPIIVASVACTVLALAEALRRRQRSDAGAHGVSARDDIGRV